MYMYSVYIIISVRFLNWKMSISYMYANTNPSIMSPTNRTPYVLSLSLIFLIVDTHLMPYSCSVPLKDHGNYSTASSYVWKVIYTCNVLLNLLPTVRTCVHAALAIQKTEVTLWLCLRCTVCLFL